MGRKKKFNWRQWAEAALEGGGGDSHEEEIASLVVLGSCQWSPEGFGGNSGGDYGPKVSFRQATVRAPFILWSGPDCTGGQGALYQTGRGSGPIPTNRIIKTAAYLWAKNRFTALVRFVLGRLHFRFYHTARQIVVSFSRLRSHQPRTKS